MMLATQLNTLINDGSIRKNAVIKLTKYVVNALNGKRIVIILGLEVLDPDAGRVIGMLEQLSLVHLMMSLIYVNNTCMFIRCFQLFPNRKSPIGRCSRQ